MLTVLIAVPLLPTFRYMQRRQLVAYEWCGSRVGDHGRGVRGVMGAAVVRAYGLRRRSPARLDGAIDRQYRAEMGAAKYFALMFPLADVFGAVTLAAVIGVGVWWGPGWGLDVGELVACLFLVELILAPVGELGEVLDQTQTAIAGWRKVLDVLDSPSTSSSPTRAATSPRPGRVRAEGIEFAYRTGAPVLRDVSMSDPRRPRRRRGRDGFGQDHVRQAAVPPGRPDRRGGR